MPTTTPTTPSSETAARRARVYRWPIVVVEGMPGAGKTTALTILAAESYAVVDEYTEPSGATMAIDDHPDVNDDEAHQANWLIKQTLADQARTRGPVLMDRDWLSALAYAYSTQGQWLLEQRVAWAGRQLRAKRLAVADTYVVLHVDPSVSVERRRGRLTPRHPWTSTTGLNRLAAFYADPARTLRGVDPCLGRALESANWVHLRQPSIADAARALRSAAGSI